jgi:hypothetical protein
MGTSAGEYWHIVATELPFDFPRTEPDESAPQLSGPALVRPAASGYWRHEGIVTSGKKKLPRRALPTC